MVFTAGMLGATMLDEIEIYDNRVRDFVVRVHMVTRVLSVQSLATGKEIMYNPPLG